MSNETQQSSAKGRRIMVWIAGFVWALLAAELFLRVFSPVALMPRYVVATEYGIRGNQPNNEYWHKTPDYTVRFQFNSRGIRADHDIPYEKPAGTKRVVVLGDSFGLGYGAELDATFLAVMQRQLTINGIDVEVINLSVSGHGTAEQLIALENEGLKYQPDLVLVAWHETDILNNPTSRLYALQDGVLVRRNDQYLPAVRIRDFLFSFAAYRWVAGNSHLYTLLRNRAAGISRSVLRTIRGSNRPIPASGSVPAETAYSPAERLAQALLARIRDVSRVHGAEFLILDIPDYELNSSLPIESNGGMRLFHVVDPGHQLSQHVDQPLFWLNSAGHFTPLGCEIVGALLSRYILDHRLLDGRNKEIKELATDPEP